MVPEGLVRVGIITEQVRVPTLCIQGPLNSRPAPS
jgi:hypothetical protein